MKPDLQDIDAAYVFDKRRWYRWRAQPDIGSFPSSLYGMTTSECVNYLKTTHSISNDQAIVIMKNHLLSDVIRMYNLITAGVDTNE